jgi:hypothetical protein
MFDLFKILRRNFRHSRALYKELVLRLNKQRYSPCSQAQGPGSYALGRSGPRQRPQLGDWNFSPYA